MRAIKRPRRSLIASHWPAIVAFIVALNLVFIARTVINRIPHGQIKVVTTSNESGVTKDHIKTDYQQSSTTSIINSAAKGGGEPRTCRTEPNADYDGNEALVYGDNHKTQSASDCCSSCIENPKCNVWVWCGGKSGCGGGRQYKECWLKHSADLNPENPSGRRSSTLEWVSGTVTTDTEFTEAVNKIKQAADAQTTWIANLRANTSLPLVFFDVEIKNAPIGRIEMALFTDISPRCAENFRQFTTGEAGVAPDREDVEGAKTPYHFKGASFYRIIHEFIDQSGVNVESVYGGQFKDDKGGLQLKHTHKGLLSMANMGHDTNTNHFSIMMGPAPHLNGDYTIFGQVVTGFEVVDAINALSIGKPENTATAEDGAVIADCGQIRKGTIVPNLDQE
jgi:peptidyl-prolyl isomerase D